MSANATPCSRAFRHAIADRDSAQVASLFNAGLDLDGALVEAAKHGCVVIMQYLLGCQGVSGRNKAFLAATKHGSLDGMEVLYATGAVQDRTLGRALVIAACRGWLPSIRWCLRTLEARRVREPAQRAIGKAIFAASWHGHEAAWGQLRAWPHAVYSEGEETEWDSDYKQDEESDAQEQGREPANVAADSDGETD